MTTRRLARLTAAAVMFAGAFGGLSVAYAGELPTSQRGCDVGSAGISAWASGNCAPRGGLFHVVATCRKMTGAGPRTVVQNGLSVPDGQTSSVDCRYGHYTEVHVAPG